MKKNDWKKNKIHDRLMVILAKHDAFENHVIMSQLCIHHRHQLLKSRKAMEQAKLKLNRFNLIGQILIYRLYEEFR